MNPDIELHIPFSPNSISNPLSIFPPECCFPLRGEYIFLSFTDIFHYLMQKLTPFFPSVTMKALFLEIISRRVKESEESKIGF